jgi:hypothetical protein
MRLNGWHEVAGVLQKLEREGGGAPRGWTVGQVLAHCAQSIDYSRTGFPTARGWLVRKLIGPMVMRKFLRQGFMKHDLDAPIPGAPPLPELSAEEGVAKMRKAIADFQAHPGDFAPHFAYGPVSRDQYERLHAMHLADHLAPR